MDFSIEVGEREKRRIAFKRNWWTGRVRITADGVVVAERSPWQFSTHFSLTRVTRFEFSIGDRERHVVAVEHERPRAFGGLGRQKFRVFVDGQLVEEYEEGPKAEEQPGRWVTNQSRDMGDIGRL